MEYLKEYGVKEEEIQKLKDKYNEGIIKWMEENAIIVIDSIEYLCSENIKCIYLLMLNNVKLFLETPITLQQKIETMKKMGYSMKKIQMALLQER